MKLISNSEQKTFNLGKRLGRRLRPGDVLGLIGELGSGKTTLIKGVAFGLGVKEKELVGSPSFVLIKEYDGRVPLFHFDLYRLDKIRDMEYLGIQEYLFDRGVCAIEWAQKLKMLLPDYLQINLTVKGRDKREIKFLAHGRRYKKLLNEDSLSRHLQ